MRTFKHGSKYLCNRTQLELCSHFQEPPCRTGKAGKNIVGNNKPWMPNNPDYEAPKSGDVRMRIWEGTVTGRHIKKSPSPPPKSQPISDGKRKMEVHDNNEPQTRNLSDTKNPRHTVAAPYAHVLEISSPENVVLFRKRNSKVLISVGIKESISHPVYWVLDTREVTNLINKDFLPPTWHQYICPI